MEKLNLDLSEVDGNAHMLLAHFQKQARRSDWSEEEADKVVKEAVSRDYDHLVQTLMDV